MEMGNLSEKTCGTVWRLRLQIRPASHDGNIASTAFVRRLSAPTRRRNVDSAWTGRAALRFPG
jgi:hypothetical protein